MSKQMKAFLTGMGSILDVTSSSANYLELVPRLTVEQRMRKNWEKTGKHLSNAMGRFENEQKQK